MTRVWIDGKDKDGNDYTPEEMEVRIQELFDDQWRLFFVMEKYDLTRESIDEMREKEQKV